MLIPTSRFLLRDFVEQDRAAFITYEMEARQRLQDHEIVNQETTADLFDLCLSWQQEQRRLNFQIGVFEPNTSSLCGCSSLRKAGQREGTAVFRIKLSPDCWGRYRMALGGR
jgi:ribosomal-protein-alanine N-acetyltransferase